MEQTDTITRYDLDRLVKIAEEHDYPVDLLRSAAYRNADERHISHRSILEQTLAEVLLENNVDISSAEIYFEITSQIPYRLGPGGPIYYAPEALRAALEKLEKEGNVIIEKTTSHDDAQH